MLMAFNAVVKDVLIETKNTSSFAAENIVGVGVDTTGSTSLHLDENDIPLAMLDEFKDLHVAV